MSEQKKLKVKINNKEYSLLVENEQIASDLANYFNNALEDTRKELTGQSDDKLIVITALNIAYDLWVEKKNFREFSAKANDKVKKIKLLLNNSSTTSNPS